MPLLTVFCENNLEHVGNDPQEPEPQGDDYDGSWEQMMEDETT